MLRDNLGWYLGAVVSVLTIMVLVTTLFGARRNRIEAARRDLSAEFDRGSASRNNEVALLKAQLEDARSDRDDARRDRDLARQQLAFIQRPGGYPPTPGHFPLPGGD